MFGNGKKKKDGNAKKSAKGTKRPNSQSASTKASKASQPQQTQHRKRAATNRKFDETTTTIRNGVIDQCVKKKEAHLAERQKDGKSQVAPGFMKKMIEEMNESCPMINIKIDDVENEIRRRNGEKEKKEKKRRKSKSNKAAKTNPPKENHPPSFVIQGRRISSASSSAPAPPPLQPTNTAVLPSSQPNTVPSWQGNMALNVLATLASAVTTSASTLSSKMM